MYEAYFGLRVRPFAAVPQADAQVQLPAVAEAIERLDRCVRGGQGIAILTAAAGRGKTQLCLTLAERWAEDFTVAYLANAGYPTRRGLLQAILCELGHAAVPATEAELRMKLTAEAHQALEAGRGLLVIFDEAHRYSDRLLEEIRQLTNLAAGGEPLVRVMLAAREELEERLAEPGFDGIEDRIGGYAELPRLITVESADYLRGRAAWAGSDLGTLFDSAAVEAICRASGGTPRCLNQLADHALLLAFVAGQQPAGVSLVREALDDLKRLPLQWVGEAAADVETVVEAAETDETQRLAGELPPLGGGVIEVGAEQEFSSGWLGDSDEWVEPVSHEPEQPKPYVSAFGGRRRERRESAWWFNIAPVEDAPQLVPSSDHPEEFVTDRYTPFDAAMQEQRWSEDQQRAEEPTPSTPAAEAGATPVAGEAETASGAAPKPEIDPFAILDRIEPLVQRELAEDVARIEPSGHAGASSADAAADTREGGGGQSRERMLAQLLDVLVGSEAVAQAAARPVDRLSLSSASMARAQALAETESISAAQVTRCSSLFTELRRKRVENQIS